MHISFIKQTKLVVLFSAIVGGTISSSPLCYANQTQERALFSKTIEESREGKTTAAGMGSILTTGKIKAKEWRFLYQTSETFDNNIFLDRKKTRCDWVTRASPELRGMIQDSRKVLSLSAGSDIVYYAQNGHMTDWNGFRIAGNTLFFRNSKIKLRLGDSLQRSSYIGNSSHDKAVKWLQNIFGSEVQYDLSPKSSFLLDYTQKLMHYQSCIFESKSYMQQVITPSFLWRFSPKTTFYASYSLGLIHYPKDHLSHATSHQPLVGFTNAFTPKSTIDFRFGYIYKIFSSSVVKDTGTFVGIAGYNYLWNKKTSLRLFAGRSMQETTLMTERYVEQTMGGFGISHLFTPKLSAKLSTYLGRCTYAQKTDNTGILGMETMIGYSLNPSLNIALRYNFSQGFAKTKNNRYQDNQVSLTLNGIF